MPVNLHVQCGTLVETLANVEPVESRRLPQENHEAVDKEIHGQDGQTSPVELAVFVQILEQHAIGSHLGVSNEDPDAAIVSAGQTDQASPRSRYLLVRLVGLEVSADMGIFDTLKNLANTHREESKRKAADEKAKQEAEAQRPTDIKDLWSKVDHIALIVSDVEKSLDFYTNTIGLRHIKLNNIEGTEAWLTSGTLKICLTPGDVPEDRNDQRPYLALAVADLEATKARMEDLGIAFEQTDVTRNPHCEEGSTIQGFKIKDPDGNVIVLGDAKGLEGIGPPSHPERALEFLAMKAFHSVKSRVHLLENLMAAKDASSELSVINEDKEKELLEEASVENWSGILPDKTQLWVLEARHGFYGDLVQNGKFEELSELLKRFNNDVEAVLNYLQGRRERKGTQTFIPPELVDENDQKHQLPSFEMRFYCPMQPQDPTEDHPPTNGNGELSA
eukprot:maker-scaffold194_size270518-snap-gene-1.29 protein:Tk00344 transcript:maker-scaffold194_size270518-snap-gene-1.29-mRNA-1 annotation:"lactoylglutathione lyase"